MEGQYEKRERGMIVNVINLPRRTDRLGSFKKQAEIHGFEYRVWCGIVDPLMSWRGISLAHRIIVQDAMTRGLEQVCIAEDDCIFFDGGWEYFKSNIPEKYSLYLSMIYEGVIDDKNRIVKHWSSFSGLTCYVIHNSFYLEFLNINPNNNIDKELGLHADKFEFIVSNPFVAKQIDGYSDNKKTDCKYDHLLKGRKLFGSSEVSL